MRVNVVASAYAGIGICGTLGVRGGFNLNMNFIWNPMINSRYDNVRPHGFVATGVIKFWIDALLCSIPIPKWELFKKGFGYFEDIEKINNNGGLKKSSSSFKQFTDNEIKPRPRFGGNSKFVAVKNDDNLFGGTYDPEYDWTLIEDVYDISEPKIMKYDDKKALLVYLDDDGRRSSYDRTVLKYMLYDGNNASNPWLEPRDVWINNNTADFNPYLCDCGDKILLTWSSRPSAVTEDVEIKELLKNMEIYSVFFDKASGNFEYIDADGDGENDDVERMTIDDSYDYYPKAVYDEENDAIHLYYLKKQGITDINSSDDLLDNVQTEVNGSYLMYMTYADIGDGQGKRWLRDYYYDYELSSTITPAEKQAFINQWKGQRFKNLSTVIGSSGMNQPYISDYELSDAWIFDTTEDIIAEMEAADRDFDSELISTESYIERIDNIATSNIDRYKEYNITCYVVEQDGNTNTKEDTEIYLKLQCATESNAKTIRLTHNNVADTRPKMVKTATTSYIFWIQDEGMIKMTSLTEIIARAIRENHAENGVIAGYTNVSTLDKTFLSDKISDIYPFVDNMNNVLLFWKQSSPYTLPPTEDGEVDFAQDLYVAGLIESEDENGGLYRSWSYPVPIAQNYQVNELPTVVDMGSYLIMVHNSYKMKTSDDEYIITDSNLKAYSYIPASSMIINNANCKVLSSNDDGSIRYSYVVDLENAGLYAAKGFDYICEVIYDPDRPSGGSIIAFKTDTSYDTVLPGHTAQIDGEFTLNKEQQKNLDKIIIKTDVVESNLQDYDVEHSSSIAAFQINEVFSFVKSDNYSSDFSNNNKKSILNVIQDGDDFVVEGEIINSGNVPSKGNEKIYVIDAHNVKHKLAESDIINLDVNEQTKFSIKVSGESLTNMSYGFADLGLYVSNDSDDDLSEYVTVSLSAKVPYGFKVNGSKDTVRLTAGERLKLNTTYVQDKKYIDPTMIYVVNDTNIAQIEGDTIVGLNAGETIMRLTTKEFGGDHEVKVIVEGQNKGSGSIDGGSGGGGGAGPISLSDQAVRTTNVNTTKANLTVIDSNLNPVSWIYDPISDKFKLNISVNGQAVPALNGFYAIREVKNADINGVTTAVQIVDTYYFDNLGNMITGWIKTADEKWYFFENLKTIDEGKMALGWKKIENVWYYFIEDGSMLRNTMTPDGYLVGNDGAWVAPVITTTTN